MTCGEKLYRDVAAPLIRGARGRTESRGGGGGNPRRSQGSVDTFGHILLKIDFFETAEFTCT